MKGKGTTDLSPRPFVGLCVCVRKVYCGRTADWIQMPFGVLSWVIRGMGVLDGGIDRQRGMGRFGDKLGLPIVTNGDFVA